MVDVKGFVEIMSCKKHEKDMCLVLFVWFRTDHRSIVEFSTRLIMEVGNRTENK